MKAKCLFLPFILCTLIFSATNCSQNPESSVEAVPGEDINMAVLPGQGLNHISYQPLGHCVKLGELITQSGNQTGSMAEFRLLEINSATDFREHLDVIASASFRGAGYKVKASSSLIENYRSTAETKYLMVHTRVINQLKVAKDFTYTDEVKKILENGRNDLFIKNCGTQFVTGIRTGGEFFAIFEFEIQSEEQGRQFSAALSGSGLGWKASTEINKELYKFNKYSTNKVYMYRIGTSTALPEPVSLEEYARNFPSYTQLQGSPVTLEVVTKDYNGVKPFDLEPNLASVARQEIVMDGLAKDRDMAIGLLNNVRYINSNKDEFEAFNPNDLKEAEIRSYINKISNRAAECMGDISNGCNFPEISFPTPTLPPKKNSKLNLNFVSEQFENYRYQVPQTFIQYSGPGDDDVFVSSRTYVLPKQALPNSIDNGIYLTVGKVKCESRDAYLDLKRKLYEKRGVPLFEDLVQGGSLNARSISWKKDYSYIMTVFDRDPVDGTCFVNNTAVYGPGEWHQHKSVIAVLQNMAKNTVRN